MKTITAKELRDNLEEIGRKVSQGQRIRVTYRQKLTFDLVPSEVTSSSTAPGSHEAMDKFLKRLVLRRRATGKPVFDPDRPIKELYHEMLDNDPKYKGFESPPAK